MHRSLARLVFLLLFPLVMLHIFTDDNWASYNAYGVKLAFDDRVIVEARNADSQFLVHVGPFNTSNLTIPCHIDYDTVGINDTSFVYSVAVPRMPHDASIIFIGENDDNSVNPAPFVGHLQVDSMCNVTSHVHYFYGRSHEEFFVIDVNQLGEMAFGFTTQWAFSYDLNTHAIQLLSSWPSSTMTPRAIDTTEGNIAILAGYIENSQRIQRPIVHMLQLNVTSVTIIDTWEYVPNPDAWQAQTYNKDARKFTPKHIISVAIHHNTSQLLIGIPSTNTVFWFRMTTNLSLLYNRTHGAQLGYGVGVAWNDYVDEPYPVVLENAHSLSYKWLSSSVYWYDEKSFLSIDPVLPLFPTNQQPRWIDLSPEFINVAAMSVNIAILDSLGQIYIVLAAPEGTFSSTDSALGLNPAFSAQSPCPAGMQKNWFCLDFCYPCMVGTMSSSEGSVDCTPYLCDDVEAFCPLGSVVNDTYEDFMIGTSPAHMFPRSPESIIFDDILVSNLFSIGSSPRCVVSSPSFWALLVTSIAMLILVSMAALKFSIRCHKYRTIIKKIFRQVDLLKEGELWMGGLASFAIVVLLIFAYTFSHLFLNQYPADDSLSFPLACDTSISNAKFDSSVQSLSMLHPRQEQPIFDLLNEQVLTLTVDFVNTQMQCSDVKTIEIVHGKPKSIPSTCTVDRMILTVSTVLHSHTMSVVFEFDAVQSIGGLRLGLEGPEEEREDHTVEGRYTVRELKFIQPVFMYNRTLVSDPIIDILLTRVINHTNPLSEGQEHLFDGMWIPNILNEPAKLFLTLEQFLYYGLLKPSVTVSLSETNNYILNVQEPIARKFEVIFHNLLFTVVCLEIFGLLFLIVKLLFVPFVKLIHRLIAKRFHSSHPIHHTTWKTPVSSIEVTTKTVVEDLQ